MVNNCTKGIYYYTLTVQLELTVILLNIVFRKCRLHIFYLMVLFFASFLRRGVTHDLLGQTEAKQKVRGQWK